MRVGGIGQILLTVFCATAPGRLVGQNAATGLDAAALITAAELARYAQVLAHDSIRHRPTPSQGLERTARYVADQFKQLGLVPGGDYSRNDTRQRWLQRYPAAGRSWVDYAGSQVLVTTLLAARGKRIVGEAGDTLKRAVVARCDAAAYFLDSTAVPARDAHDERRTVLVAGQHTAASVRQADLSNAQVLFVPPAGQDSAAVALVLDELRARSHGMIVLRAADSAIFAARVQAARRTPRRRTDVYLREASFGPWAAEVWPRTVAGALAAAGIDLPELGAAAAPIVRPLPLMRVQLMTSADPARIDTTTWPNVIGQLEGGDSAQATPLVVSAHLEHTGRLADLADGIAGTEQDASEVVELLVLAQALTRSGLRLKRPVIFLVSSGGAPGTEDWGSNYFLEDRWGPLGPGIGIHLALERLPRSDSARLLGDTLLVGGTKDIELPRPLAWILGVHPELGLVVVDESTLGCPLSGCWIDRSAFGRFRIPSLAVHSDLLLPDAGTATSSDRDPSRSPALERAARGLRFAYYLIEALATTREQVGWSADSRSRLQLPSSAAP